MTDHFDTNSPEADTGATVTMPTGDDRIRAEDLAVVMVPIDSVQPHPMNNNVGDVDTIAESMDELGFFDPITVQKSSGNIITGNHTWKVRKAKGLTDIAAIVVDVSDFNALRMMAVHNRSNRKVYEDGQATFDLLQTLQDLGHEDYGLAGTGYDLDDVEALLAEYGHADVPEFPEDDEPPALIPRQAAAEPEEDDEDEPASTRSKSAPRLTGMKEVAIVLTAAEASDFLRALASCRKRMPGGYPSGRIAYAAVRYLELALDNGAPHPEPCPCDNCADHGEGCACLECTAARAAAEDDQDDEDQDGAGPDGDAEPDDEDADEDAEVPAAAAAAP